MEQTLPMRFWHSKDQPDEFRLAWKPRTTSADFLKLFNREFNPILKKDGFRAKGFNAIKLLPERNLALMSNFSVSKWGQRGELTLGVHPVFLPVNNAMFESPWNSEKCKIGDFLFRKKLTLSNGNPEFDMGGNETEALETLRYLKESFERQASYFFSEFDQFPEPFTVFPIPEYKNMKAATSSYYFTDFHFTWLEWVARINAYHGLNQRAKELITYAIEETRANKNLTEDRINKFIIPRMEKFINELKD